MHRPQILVFGLAVLLSASASAQTHAQRPLSVTFGSHDAIVSGLTPGGRAVIFGAGLRPQGQYSLMFRWSGSADDTDRDGALSVDFGTEIPFSTIWCVADATNGEYVITTPGAPVPVSALRPAALRRRGQTVSQFAFDHTLLELLYIEPGRGAWICRDEDGSRTDEDGPNGLTTVSAGRFKPLWTGPEPPSELRPSGVLVAIDPIRLEVTASRLDAALLGAVK